MMKIFDNINEIVRDDMKVTIEKGSRVLFPRFHHLTNIFVVVLSHF